MGRAGVARLCHHRTPFRSLALTAVEAPLNRARQLPPHLLTYVRMSEIYVYGSYRVRPEFLEAVHASLVEHEDRTAEEPGCLHAAVSQDLADPLALYSMQRWADQASLDAHRALPSVQALSASATERLDGPFTLTTLVPEER